MGSILGVSTEDLLTVAKILTALTVIFTTLILVLRWKPVRWVFRRLVSEPVGAFFRDQVHEATEPQFTRAAAALEAHTAYEHEEAAALRQAVETTNVRLDGIDRRVTHLADRLDALDR